MKTRLHLIGAGNLGSALLQAWVGAPDAEMFDISVSDPYPPSRVRALCQEFGVRLNERAASPKDICVLAIKPQSFPTVLPSLAWEKMDETLFVSIAAGVSIQSMRALLPSANSIIRAMPNLPAAIGQGATLLCAGDLKIPTEDRTLITGLFDAVGKTIWTKTEDELDRLMGISGCGPAYVFLLAEVLEEVAASYGAAPRDARTLAEATIIGAANHMALSDMSAADLRSAVTSPGGTTAEAIGVLQGDPSLRSLMKAAVDAAYMRAHALSAI